MKDILYFDFETRSAINLKVAGLPNYAKDPSTEVMCIGWVIGDGEIHIWEEGEPFPEEIKKHIRNDGLICGHNLLFEHIIYENVLRDKFLCPEFKLENGVCTMSMAFSAALPGSLEAVAPVLGLDVQKDMAGNRAMMKFAVPKKDGSFWTKVEKPELWQHMILYCKLDVEIARKIYKRLPKLSKYEHRVWRLNKKINDRGIPIDVPAVEKAHEVVLIEKLRLNEQIQKLTNGGVSTCGSNAQLKEWLKWEEVETPSTDKSHVAELLNDDTVSELVKKVLRVKQKGSKSSNAKLKKMLNVVEKDGRVRGVLQYHIATTGRFSAWSFQIHNMPRRTCGQDEVDAFFILMES